MVLGVAALLTSLALPSLADVLRGRIKEVSADKGTVILLEGHKDYRFVTSGDTEILNVKGEPLRDGLSSADLKAERSVTASYSVKDGRSVLESLQLRP